MPGERARFSYDLTPADEELLVVLGALQQWGDAHVPPSFLRRRRGTDEPLGVAFVDGSGNVVALEDVEFVTAG